jgi:hypothetical protein
MTLAQTGHKFAAIGHKRETLALTGDCQVLQEIVDDRSQVRAAV